VTTFPVTVEPTCWNVAVAVEPPQPCMSSDWKVPLQEPVRFPAGAATLEGPVIELEF